MKYALKKTLALALVSVAALQGSAAMAVTPATSWEVSGEFDYLTLPSNATGVWTYGWRTGITSAPTQFTPMAAFIFQNPIFYRGFQMSPGSVLPHVGQNTKMTAQNVGFPPIEIPARGIELHPGYSCQTAIVRFVAPYPAQYRVSGQFYGLNPHGSGTQTTNRVISSTPTWPNPAPLHSGSISMPNSKQSSFTSKTVMLPTGGTLDFEVGCGPGNNYFFGSTGLHAVIEKTPVEYCEWNGVGENPC